jgi:hypothetical protein
MWLKTFRTNFQPQILDQVHHKDKINRFIKVCIMDNNLGLEVFYNRIRSQLPQYDQIRFYP